MKKFLMRTLLRLFSDMSFSRICGILILFFLIPQQAFTQNRGVANPVGTSERRIALVMGNIKYSPEIGLLKNAVHDAEDMKVALEKLGFEVILVLNSDYRTMIAALNKFKEKLNPETIALFYFAGHGTSFNNKNYLLPIDAKLECLEKVEEYGISLNRIMADMESKSVKNSLVFLDACRDQLQRRSCETKRNILGENRLVPFANPAGSILVYATEDGSKADDTSPNGRNGLFTGALLKYLTTPNLTLTNILNQASRDVLRLSNNQQTPARYDKIYGDFYFITTNNSDLPPFMEMVAIPGGTFDMGSLDGEADEKPIHTVTVRSFMMGKYEVTVGQFAQFVAETNYQTDAEKAGKSYYFNPDTKNWKDTTGIHWRFGANLQKLSAKEYSHPVVHVSYNDALAFCDWLSTKEGKIYRLPTEAQWEYAAGNGSLHHTYSWGSNQPTKAVANILDEQVQRAFTKFNWTKFDRYNDGYVYTAPVGSFDANGFGLHDMTGNVWEWCSDWYAPDWYGQAAASQPNPENTNFGPKQFRVLRGGSWIDSPGNARVAYRFINTPDGRYDLSGFRVVVSQVQ